MRLKWTTCYKTLSSHSFAVAAANLSLDSRVVCICDGAELTGDHGCLEQQSPQTAGPSFR